MKITVAKALKEKSRLVGRINNLMNVIGKENAKVEGSSRSIDVRELQSETMECMERLITVKGAIAVANHPVVAQIVELEEIKSMLSKLDKINTDDTPKHGYGMNKEQTINVVINAADILLQKQRLQERADALQDKLDEFNVRAIVEI